MSDLSPACPDCPFIDGCSINTASTRACPRVEAVPVPVIDTGLGREVGYGSDAQLIAAGESVREILAGLLKPEALARIEAVEVDLLTDAVLKVSDSALYGKRIDPQDVKP